MSALDEPPEGMDEDLALAEDRVHRLLDIVTQEVSLVNRAANRRRWLVRKGAETMENQEATETETTGDETTDEPTETEKKGLSLSKTVKATVAKLVESAQGRIAKLITAIKALKEDDEAKGLPVETADELKGIASELRANAADDTPKVKDEDGETESEIEPKPAPKTAPKQSMPHVQKDDVAKAGISGDVKTKVLAAVEGAVEKLTSVATQVKDAEETDDEDKSDMPATLAKELEGIAAALDGIVQAYPSPKAEKAEENDADNGQAEQATSVLDVVKGFVTAGVDKGEDVEHRANKLLWKVMGMIDRGDLAPEEDKAAVDAIFGALKTAVAKADTADVEKQLSARDALKAAKQVLGAVMAKLKPGQAIDEDSYQKLDKLRALVDSAGPIREGEPSEETEDKSVEKQETCAYCKAPATKVVVCDDDTKIFSCNLHLGKAREDAKGHGGVKSEDAVKVAKAGAKMSQARRKQFETAIKSLLSLFKDVMPDKDLGKFPHLVVSKAATEATELRGKLEKTEGDLVAVRKELSELKERPAASQVATVETTVPPDNGAKVSWPMDLNAE